MATLKDQLAKEIQKKQSYITRTAQKSDEIRDLRGKLEDSLHTVARDTVYEPSVLERESQKLEDSVDASYSTSPMRRTKSASPPVKFPADKVTTSTPAYGGISPSRRTTPISSSLARRTTPGVSPLRKTRKSTTWTRLPQSRLFNKRFSHLNLLLELLNKRDCDTFFLFFKLALWNRSPSLCN